MFANIMASFAVVVIPIYFYLRRNSMKVDKDALTSFRISKYTAVITIVGFILLYLSIMVEGMRFSLLPLLYSLSIHYLGWKVTVPSLLIVGLGHLYLAAEPFPYLTWLIYLFMTVTFSAVQAWAVKRWKEYGALLISLTYYLLLTTVIRYIMLDDNETVLLFYFVSSLFNYVMLSAVFVAINDLRDLQERVDFDYLTRLLNVRKFKESLTKLEKFRDVPISVAVMDIDWFKSYNDKYGHDAGDKILWGVAQVFSAYSTNEVTIYRIGGEEFAIIMKRSSLEEAELIVADIMDNVVNRPIPINRYHSVFVTLSVGLALANENENLIKTWKRADYAMYEAKRNGRNQLFVDRRYSEKRPELEKQLQARESM